ncbi:hypothetical protein [Microbacterium sp.]|uniref:hypothetical protein n=1 Tax=Microbacterium sp. TaxID=51671 RepID=UPI003F9613F1
MNAQRVPLAESTRVNAAAFGVRAAVITAVAVLLASISMLVGAASPAPAASRVDVSPVPSADGATTVSLSGSGFQYQPNAPGGVYVFFGTVSDPSTNAWAPSQGGRSGQTFGYAATNGTRLLVAFDGGSSASAANGVIDANGNWSAQMTIPGSKFTATFGDPHSGNDQSGQEIDCLQVQCGIITIGAHGSINANNESFTPVSFATSGGEVLSGEAAPQDFGGSGEQSNNDEATELDVPGSEADEAEQTEQQEQQAATSQTAAPTEKLSGLSTPTLVVFGVLAFALLALLVAIVLVLVKRSRAKRAAAATAADASTTGEEVSEELPVPEEAGR